ncbi:MAG: monothiol glutaredoxin [Bradymonadia bacterium]|jgi:monothiol glutaredoxin
MSKKIDLPIMNPEFEAGASAPAATIAHKTRAEGGDVMSEIAREVSDNSVFLYMKGTPQMPMCGFSARVTGMLNHIGVPYAACNILDDSEKRQAVKVYTEWPTIPQLYVNGEFVGGCDIITEMFESGELETMVKTSA